MSTKKSKAKYILVERHQTVSKRSNFKYTILGTAILEIIKILVMIAVCLPAHVCNAHTWQNVSDKLYLATKTFKQ